MPIKVFNNQDKVKLNNRSVVEYLPDIEDKLCLEKDSIYNIIFVDDKKIKELNKKYRNTNRTTDVLSFRYSKKDTDIFISTETAKDNAKFFKEKFNIEILRLIIHGILHALDFTDYSKKTKEKMWNKQERVLKCILH